MADDDSYRSLGQTVSDTRAQVKQGKQERKTSGVRGAVGSAGRSLQASGQEMMAQSRSEAAERASNVPSYKRGGKVKRTGMARVHKGEVVVPRGKVKRMKKAMRRMKSNRG